MTMPVVPRMEMPPTMPRRAVERLQRHLLAVRHGNLDLEIGVVAGRLARSPRRSSCAAPD